MKTVFTAPDMPPTGSWVEILELASDGDPNHKVGDRILVSGCNLTNYSEDDCSQICYHAFHPETMGTWVRKVALVDAPPTVSEKDEYAPVNPKHYQGHPSGLQCIQITEHMPANVAAMIKYFWRCGLKEEAPTLGDLRKGVWYANRELMRMGGESMLKDGLQGPPVLGKNKE